jgi:hypothetical protein
MQECWRLSKYRVKKMIECFCVDLPATKTAVLLGYHRKPVDRYFNLFREQILIYQHHSRLPFAGAVELAESYFGARRGRGKSGRGATGKTPVLGVFEKGWASLHNRREGLFQSRAKAPHSRANPRTVNPLHGWLESRCWVAFEWLRPLPWLSSPKRIGAWQMPC